MKLDNTIYCEVCDTRIRPGDETILYGCDYWFCTEECLHSFVDDRAEHYIVGKYDELERV